MIKIPKDGILAKVIWRDVTAYDKFTEERGRNDMVQKCSVGILMPGKTHREVRILSEWDIDHTTSNDAYDVVLTRDAIDEIIPLTEKKCSRISKRKMKTK